MVASQTTDGDTTSTDYCSPGSCVNGDCVVVNDTEQCFCQGLFSGEQCEIVDLDVPEFMSFAGELYARWEVPPRLTEYSFVFQRLDSEEDDIIIRYKFYMRPIQLSTVVASLRGGVGNYNICIDFDYKAQLAVDTQSMDDLAACKHVEMVLNYHTFIGYTLLGATVLTIIIAIYVEREELEFLYFYKPFATFYDESKGVVATKEESSADIHSVISTRRSTADLNPFALASEAMNLRRKTPLLRRPTASNEVVADTSRFLRKGSSDSQNKQALATASVRNHQSPNTARPSIVEFSEGNV